MHHHRFYLVLFCIHGSMAQTTPSQMGIAAYLPDYRAAYNVNASAPHLTDLILFSIQPHSRGMIGGCCLQPKHFQLGRNVREHNSELRLWVTIGGAGRADAIPAITADAIKRKRLIDAILRLSQEQDFYGIDLDIYYPVTQEQLMNYQRFVEEASTAWHEQSIQISVTWHPQRMKLPPSLFDMVDRVNLMAYDIMTSAGTHHSSMIDTKEAVESLLEQDCPVDKIWLGIPVYGRKLKNPGHAETFEVLYKGMQASKTKEYNVETTFRHDGFEWDSPKRVRSKVDYAYSRQLGGVFFWELGQDYQDQPSAPGGILLEAASIRRAELLSSNRDEL